MERLDNAMEILNNARVQTRPTCWSNIVDLVSIKLNILGNVGQFWMMLDRVWLCLKFSSNIVQRCSTLVSIYTNWIERFLHLVWFKVFWRRNVVRFQRHEWSCPHFSNSIKVNHKSCLHYKRRHWNSLITFLQIHSAQSFARSIYCWDLDRWGCLDCAKLSV
jgi:hypothetical protein